MPAYFVVILLVVLLFLFIMGFIWINEMRLPPISTTKGGAITSKELISWFQLLEKKKKFNGIVYARGANANVIEESLGIAASNNQHPIHEHTRFRLASISKQFTAFGVMVLLKKFPQTNSYDTFVKDLIPEFPYPGISLRNLLTHTSGIEVNYLELAKKNKPFKNYVLTIQDAVRFICENPESGIDPPRTKFLYNNTNYILLAGIIERVCGEEFEMFMNNQVFMPIGLRETMVWNLNSKGSLENLEDVATGFTRFLNLEPTGVKPNWVDGVAGDGGIFSSLHDLKNWLELIEGNALLDEKEMKPAFEPLILKNGKKSNYGFGWVLSDDIIMHDGKWLATNSYIAKNRKTGNGIILVDNSMNPRFNKILKPLISFAMERAS
ncbi:MAG: beta-lactamase family protein [Balneolales bacterium]|nr:beta-lactamase family protein [Balneolales bacterium]